MSKRALAVALSLFCLIGLSVCSMTMYGIFQHERSLSAYSKSIGTENSQSIHAGIWLKESEGLLNIMTNMENFRTKITNDNSSTKVVLSDKNYFKTEMIKEIIGEEKLHIYAKLQRNINNDSDVVFNDQEENITRIADGMLQLLHKSSLHPRYIAIFVDEGQLRHRMLTHLLEYSPYFDTTVISYDIISNISKRNVFLEVLRFRHSAILVDCDGPMAWKVFKLAEETGVSGLNGDITWILSERAMDTLPLGCGIPHGSYYGIKLQKNAIKLTNLVGKIASGEKTMSHKLRFKEVYSYRLWADPRTLSGKSWKHIESFKMDNKTDLQNPFLPRLKVSFGIAEPWCVSAKLEEKFGNCIPGGRKGGRFINGRYEPICLYGFSVDILKLLEERLGFVGILSLSTDEKFGTFYEENGTADGVIGDIINGKGDLGIDLIEHKTRSKVLDFTTPYLINSLELAYLQRPELKEAVIFGPFSPQLWLGILGTISILVLVFWMMERASPYGHHQRKKRIEEHSGKFGLVDSTNFIMGTFFTGEIIKEKPNTMANHIATIFVAIMSILIISAYSANLITFLVVVNETPIIYGLLDPKLIGETSKMKVGIVKSTAATGYLKTHSDQRIQKMYRERTIEFDTLESAILSLRQKKIHVIISDDMSLVFMQSMDLDCEIKVMRSGMAELGIGISMRKQFTWKKRLNAAAVDIVNSGLVENLAKKWFNKRKCTRSNSFNSLNIKSIPSLFMWLSIGILLCILIFGITVAGKYLRSILCT